MGGQNWSKGGKGGWKSYGNFSGGGKGQFGGMASQWQNMMSEMQAMGQMSQISQMLAQQQAAPPTSSSHTNQPPSTEAATDLVQAVTQLLENRSNKSPTDTRLTNTIKRLHELMGNSSSDEPFDLENHPAFKKLRAEFAGLTETVGAQGKQLSGLQRTAEETQGCVKDMFAEFKSFISSPPSWQTGKGGAAPGEAGVQPPWSKSPLFNCKPKVNRDYGTAQGV